MFSVIVTVLVGAIATTSVYVAGQLSTTNHQSSTNSSSSSSAEISTESSSSANAQDIQISTTSIINQATSSATEQLDTQRQEAIQQTKDSFDAAISQIEEQKNTSPEFIQDALSNMQLQLQNSRDSTIDTFDNQLRWPN